MTVKAGDVFDLLRDYRNHYLSDDALVSDLAARLGAHGRGFLARSNPAGHITCGAVLLDNDEHVLMVRHNTLGTWLTPGGHLEAADSTLQSAARRELAEETGFSREVTLLESFPVHIDRHTIPANVIKSEPEHEHWDFRFLFLCRGGAAAVRLEEVSAAEWLPIGSLPALLSRRVQEALNRHGG